MAARQHPPWIERLTQQLQGAYGALERVISASPLARDEGTIDQAGISTAVAWQFTQHLVPGIVTSADHPAISGFSLHAETLTAFRRAPHGPGTYPVTD